MSNKADPFEYIIQHLNSASPSRTHTLQGCIEKIKELKESYYKPAPRPQTDVVRYDGATDAQVRWGGGNDPRLYLGVGLYYEVRRREVHSMHTRLYLDHWDGLWFNSVCFSDVSQRNPNEHG